MQGMRFLIVGETGPTNHGIIAQQITPEKYLCTFARVPQSSRVVDITEIQQWNLFPTEDTMNTFIAALAKNKPPVGTGGERDPAEGKNELPPARKKVTKKKVKPSKKTVARARGLANKASKKKTNGKK